MRVFRDVELVEQLGSGMRRMLEAYSPDIFHYTENFFHVVFPFPAETASPFPRDKWAESGAESGAESRVESDISGVELKILCRLDSFSATKRDLAVWLGKGVPDGHRNRTIGRLLKVGMIERTIPDKPNSRMQKYRLTGKGRELLLLRHRNTSSDSSKDSK
jgi:predicted HTH transcriptional regulator